MRIRGTRHRPDPGGRVGGVTAPGERACQLGLSRAHHEAEHGVERGEPIPVGQAGPPERGDQRVSRGETRRRREHLKSRPAIYGGRIGLWGTSLGGMNVIRVAAAREDVAVAVVQCPIVHGPGAARRLGPLAALRLTPAVAEDLLRMIGRRGRRYVPIVGPPGSLAMVTVAGAESGWNSTVPAGFAFDNRIVAADAVAMVTTSATRHARRIEAPLLVCVCDRENLMDPAYAALVARRAPRGVARHYDSSRFAIYHPPLLPRVLADQTAFLQEH
ncbi:MAG: hypothetical protein QOF47_1709, partial [Mycobacterium sp.]|nr:hypothetical protein [Mycobacterium sp.]